MPGGMRMDHQRLEQIGEKLRSLGHDRREVVEAIVATAHQGAEGESNRLYRRLDQISAECISLMEDQRQLIATQLNDGIGP